MGQIKYLIAATVLTLFISQAQSADLKEIEQELSDSVITTIITAKYTKNKDLNPLKISVSTEDGIVQLSGHVKNKQAFVDALRLAKSTHGVKEVDTDNLEIKVVNTALADAYITAKVEAAILKAKVLDDESIPLVGINASTTNGIVTLSGDLKTDKSITAILKRVSSVRGVKKVISNLHLTTNS
ncbi:BON domain-containing protein [Legionella nagasakiensis]|uniref:BON domain-containing protein n=1 Tax=Legionella nagasakiensis TaxID=535290 RepID=UPI0010549503|nr:BON domain-containing protein [Legionella nagasakiensis]